MKIGILSLVLHNNYGGILQAYALQTVLERMGHEVVIFNKEIPLRQVGYKILLKRLIMKMLGRDVVVFSERKTFQEEPIVNKSLIDFRKRYIHEEFINQLKDIADYKLDCIVVGSDQVWRAKYFKEQWKEPMENAFLSFTRGWTIKRISYAASFGTDCWEYTDNETDRIRESVKSFDAISVRESSGIPLLKKCLNVDSELVLDPTLLLSKNDYINLIKTSKAQQSPGNLLVYLLDPTTRQKEIIKSIEERKGLTAFSVNRRGVSLTAPIEQRILPSIESRLRGFYDAELIVTDSFHACVFSIIFGKPFIVFGNKQRGMSRFESLLSKFCLSSCLVDESIDINNIIDLINQIEYSNVAKQFEQERLASQKFLEKAFVENSNN